MKIWKQAILLYMGGMAYCTVELLWRGRTDGSMFLLGGGCFVALGQLGRAKLPLPLLVTAGAVLVTGGELLTGLLVNRDYAVWDYRAQPWNLWGQICLRYSLLWMPLSLAAMQLYDRAEKKLQMVTSC